MLLKTIKIVVLTVLFSFACFGIACGLWIAARFAYTLSPPIPLNPGITPADLVSTLLTGVTVSLGILAVVIAGLAIWGYLTIKEEARRIAEAAAKEVAQDAATNHLNSVKVQKRLVAEIRRLVAEKIEKEVEGIDMPIAYSAPATASKPPVAASPGADEKTVGKRYPKKRGETK